MDRPPAGVGDDAGGEQGHDRFGGGSGRGPGVGALGGLLGAAGVAGHDARGDRGADQHDQGQAHVLAQHQGHGGDDGQGVLHIVDQAGGGRLAHQPRLVEDRRQVGAGVGRAQLGQVGPHQAAEQLDLDLADHAVADAVDQHRLADLAGGPQQGDRGDGQGDVDEGRGVLVDEQLADRRAQEVGEAGAEGGHAGGADHRQQQRRPVRRQVGAVEAQGDRAAGRAFRVGSRRCVHGALSTGSGVCVASARVDAFNCRQRGAIWGGATS